MVIDICNVAKKLELNKGDVIVAKHKVKKDKMLYYKLIEEGAEGVFRLLNLGSNNIMSTFRSIDPMDAIGYVTIACKSEILEIVPSKKLKLTTISAHDMETY